MTDEQNPALEAGDEVMAEAIAAEASRIEDNGQGESQPAEVDGEAAGTEEKSKSAERRERRKAAQDTLRASEADANARASTAQAQIDKMRQAAQSIKKPTNAEYPDYEEYQAALSAHHSLVAMDARHLRQLEEDAEKTIGELRNISSQKQRDAAQNWASQVQEAKAKYPDFAAVALSDNVPITKEMARFIADSDVGADIAYEMGKNPAIATAMHGKSEVEIARAIGRLEAQLSAPKPKVISSAPPPINPVRGKSITSKDPEDMSPKEYGTWINSGGTF